MSNRFFEVVSAYANQDIRLPQRQTSGSAGYDFESAIGVVINPNEMQIVPTGVKSYMQSDEVLKLYVRSSLAIKKNLTLANNVGIIDSDYYNNESNEGNIGFPLYNFGTKPITIAKGERIGQGVFVKFLTSDDDKPVKDTRVGGMGSTGTN